ncbi:DUF1501 domain-containing protein [Vitiosangium sp. GDMCC 1.1324]|uniref:DUF1501 domain-containing protein n=1 Tax=Vitiosangium sp. (strain GDMCC 1.1324) TaxID=2138576 RepID=UPI000D388746|nr:DUF1501 domain-containing protein [Vitiosangium sp. GDMCC 1.1324]PTL81931.1 transcriptional initiation protein Tat [Vitiosangium sp. GDMCC 1.1324]
MSDSDDTKSVTFGRRRLLQGLGAGAAALAFPHLWLPGEARAQTSGRGSVRHLIYIRLSGGFRFTTAFNGDVDGEFNPFGSSSKRASGTEWGVGKLLERASWLDGEENKPRRELGMKPVAEFSNEMCVLPCVDHEPFSARADGGHGTGLERFLTGYVGGATGFLTLVNYGVRERVKEAASRGVTLLPAFSLGEAGMATGAGDYATYRPPVLEGSSFERFSEDPDSTLPKWASKVANQMDARFRDRLHTALRGGVETYQQTRQATRDYGKIFRDPMLRVSTDSNDVVDGISNKDLRTLLGTDTTGQRAALALRLFHFGCPAVFLNQGGYDFHSREDVELPDEMDSANRLVSGLRTALQKMEHPEGGTYWDKTLVVLGSEFGRTTGGSRFNSANGSDHGPDLATRWMSMPFMGGVITGAGKGGKNLGSVNASNLKATGKVYSYRSVLKTMLDMLGADHQGVFPADAPIEDFFA